MKRVNAAGIALLTAGLCLAPARSQSEAADALIFAAISSPTSVSYAGTIEIVHIGDRGTEAAVYRVEHRAPDLTRRVYVEPSNLSGDAVVIKGDASFSIDVKRHRIVETKNSIADDMDAIRRNYVLLRTNYRAVREADESFDGRPVCDVALVNRYTNRPMIRVRIDRETKLPLDRQRFSPDGSLVSETHFENVRFTRAFPTSDFAIPTHYAVVAGPAFGQPMHDLALVVRAAGFAARTPKFLPEGFSPVEGTAVAIKGVRTVHMLYSDGIRTISLFENAHAGALDMARLHPMPVRISGHSAESAEVGATRLLAWSAGSIHYALVGELSLKELQRIAASVAP